MSPVTCLYKRPLYTTPVLLVWISNQHKPALALILIFNSFSTQCLGLKPYGDCNDCSASASEVHDGSLNIFEVLHQKFQVVGYQLFNLSNYKIKQHKPHQSKQEVRLLRHSFLHLPESRSLPRLINVNGQLATGGSVSTSSHEFRRLGLPADGSLADQPRLYELDTNWIYKSWALWVRGGGWKAPR